LILILTTTSQDWLINDRNIKGGYQTELAHRAPVEPKPLWEPCMIDTDKSVLREVKDLIEMAMQDIANGDHDRAIQQLDLARSHAAYLVESYCANGRP